MNKFSIITDNDKNKIDLSVIIVNWNTKELLKSCLDSFYREMKEFTSEIFVVDNSSSDGSAEMVKKEFPEVILIENIKNVGFAKANNQAFHLAGGRFVLLLNPDTVILNNAVSKMLRFIGEKKKIGAVGPKLVNTDGSVQYECARNFPSLLTAFSSFFLLERYFPKSMLFGKRNLGWWNHEDSRAIPCLSGACVIVRKEIFDKIGLFDEHIPMFLDDVDLCYRIKRSGFINYYLSSAEVIHLVGQSRKKNKNHKLLEAMYVQAYDYFFQKHYNKSYFYLNKIITFFGSLFRMILIAFLYPLANILKKGNSEILRSTFHKYLIIFKLTLGFNENIFSKES
jgi:GT2 family glycosyltransferase